MLVSRIEYALGNYEHSLLHWGMSVFFCINVYDFACADVRRHMHTHTYILTDTHT